VPLAFDLELGTVDTRLPASGVAPHLVAIAWLRCVRGPDGACACRTARASTSDGAKDRAGCFLYGRVIMMTQHDDAPLEHGPRSPTGPHPTHGTDRREHGADQRQHGPGRRTHGA